VLASIPTQRLICLVLILLLLGTCLSAEPQTDYRYESTDGDLVFEPNEEFQRTVNPHAILSLQNSEESVVLVTSEEKKFTVTQIYDGLPSTFEDGAQCLGRILLSVDGEDAPTFLVEGMFPPNSPSTHNTLYTVTNHDRMQYTIMIHYPKELGDDGFEWAAAMLQRFAWGETKEKI
jgi:hypothetical protein